MSAAPFIPPVRTLAEFAPLLPELTVVFGAFALLMLDLFLDERRRIWTNALSIVVLLTAAAMILLGVGGHGEVMEGVFVRDTGADILKVVVLVVSAASLAYLWSSLRERGLYQGEASLLLLFTVIGMMLLISAGNLTMVYLGLELMALATCALIAFDRENPKATEAAMKSFVLGALASGMLLYGMSLLYGATGTLSLDGIREAIGTVSGENRVLLLTGMVFVVAGVAFKFGAAPFHMWLPDTYHGAPTAMTVFICATRDVAAFAMAWRLFEVAMGPLHDQWQTLVALLAVLSLAVGNLIAIAQTNLKRMLAYSTVSHVGFLLMGISGGGPTGFSASMFYAISYSIMSAAAFGAIVMLSRKGFEAERIEDYKGLSARSPWMAGLVLIVMASLAGVPPLLGFWAKMAVLRAALDGGLLWLAIAGVVFAVIGAFYYLRLIKVMYFDEPVGEPMLPRKSVGLRAMFAVNALSLLGLGLFWSPIMAWCQQAFA
jgi:NADH-quinone oxidoreductase subunit N